MLVVHHLSNSRSHRILWLLEELDVPYEIRFHERQAGSHAAPEALKDIHPLGKSPIVTRSEEHTSELQSLMRISYAVFCLKKKKQKHSTIETQTYTPSVSR